MNKIRPSHINDMRNPLLFFSDLMKQPTWIPIWVSALMVVNMASVAFWSEPLAKVIFVTFMMSAMLMMGLYAQFGFERILGLGHVPWIPLLAYILAQLKTAENGFQTYLIVLSIFIGTSLIFDSIDVWKYFSLKRVRVDGARLDRNPEGHGRTGK